MVITSKEYKSEQKAYLREYNYVWVYLGVISREAQSTAYTDAEITDFGSRDIFGTREIEAYYATLEQDFTRVDGTQYFLPRDKSYYGLWQGLVSPLPYPTIEIRFKGYSHLNIKGLTIDFGEAYPTKFEVTNGYNTFIYDNGIAGEWVTEDEFPNTEYIRITAYEMVGGLQRLRILAMRFGVGFVFDNKKLKSTQRQNTVSHVSDSLPLKQFTFTIHNYDGKFNKDNPHSFAGFLEEQQLVTWEYGRDLPDGTVYRLPGGTAALKTWSSDDTEAKFTAVGFLDYETKSFVKGLFYPNGISLYELAEIVLADAGITNYKLDTYLKKIITKNPLPSISHKGCLQRIAIASRSVLYEDREGAVVIKSSFVPDIISVDATFEHEYSDVRQILTENTAYAYADFEQDFIYVNEAPLFIPRDSAEYENNGYVSSVWGSATGRFKENPVVTIVFDSKWTFFNFALEFMETIPTGITIHCLADGAEVESFEVEEIDFTTLIEHNFYDIDELRIEFTRVKPFQRIHLTRFSLGNVTDYSIDYRDLKVSPRASSIDFTKLVNVHYYTYGESDEVKNISTVDAHVGENLATFTGKPYYGYELAYVPEKDDEGHDIPVVGELAVIESGAHYVVYASTTEAKVQISGREYQIGDQVYTENLREIGDEREALNELIDNYEQAKAVGEWLGEHYINDTEYNLQYRGEPALECDDLIYLENRFVEENLIRVTSEQINTSTGMSLSCNIKGRRISYEEPALVDFARVDISKTY